jgi:hypothetical protein
LIAQNALTKVSAFFVVYRLRGSGSQNERTLLHVILRLAERAEGSLNRSVDHTCSD